MGKTKKGGGGQPNLAAVFRHEDAEGDLDDRSRYGRMDNYEYQMPDKYDDEEIESEEAFNGADEARYGHLFKRGRTEQGGDEGDDEDEEGDGDDEEGEYEDFAMQPSSEDGDEQAGASEAGLLQRLAAMTQQGSAGSGGSRKVRGGELAEEGEFGLLPNAATVEGEAVAPGEAARLLGPGEQADRARQALRRVAQREATSVPLGSASGRRVERRVAYARARKDLSRWSAQVAENRAARQTVLGDVEDKSAVVTTAVLASTFEPAPGLEQSIAAILRESGADESNLAKYEELQMHKLTVEEVRARAAQLAKMRSLLYHQEIRDKRQSKIKSRKYRKILKKQKEKSKMTVDEVRAVNPEEAEELAEKHARDRALERITLRHRNTSKWVKGALRSGAMRDPGTREAIQAQLQQHELLRRKMGMDDDEDQLDEDFEDDDEQNNGGKSSSSSSSEEDIDDPAFDADEEPPLPEASGAAPQLAGEGHLLEELAVPQGHRVRASGFLSAGKSSAVPRAPEAMTAMPPAQEKTAQLVVMGNAIKAQLQEAPASFAAEGSTSQFHLSGKVNRSVEQIADRAALVRLAFAEDDAVQVFAEEKKRMEDGEAGKGAAAADEDLAGWGSWTGEGVAVKKKRKKRVKKARPAKRQGVGAQDHVYLNPKLSDKQKDLKTAQVPYPFTSKEQYEAHMALPLGRDFNAGLAFVDLQKPEVVVRRGSYVKPIEFVAPDEKKTRQEKKRKLRPKNLV